MAGIGLRHPHHRALLESERCTGWLEAHAENHMSGGWSAHVLDRLRQTYPLSLHGVGLSLGGAGGLDEDHLGRLKQLVQRIEPALVSEHVAWTGQAGLYLNDLLPLPWTEEALATLVAHIDQAQTALGRPILIENPSSYLAFRHAEMSEPEFLVETCRRAGCRLLLDVNNVYVSARNLGFDAGAYLEAIPGDLVGEIHLAGHSRQEVEGIELRIDDHGSPVMPEVWALYRSTLARIGPRPTLIEWDSEIPALNILLEESAKADRLLSERRQADIAAAKARHAAA
ncbi:MNIO family bufferin maturase [Hypericibacter sp.]|uniref:MNIO family bufferin maturase n=1 Tax=Hypericibacter sp. TaxID=2705401 RepID=UPI003D6C8F0F